MNARESVAAIRFKRINNVPDRGAFFEGGLKRQLAGRSGHLQQHGDKRL
jgi:hypothetical protein